MRFLRKHKVGYILLALLFCLTAVSCGREDTPACTDYFGAGRSDITAQSGDTEVTAADTAKEGELTLVMVGDVLMHTAVTESGLQDDGSYNFDHMFANVKDEISAADLALVNQEVILGGTKLGLSGYPNFNAPYEVGDALIGAGFDVVLHATNHAMDKGKDGIVNCLNYWKQHPEMTIVGINETKEAQDKTTLITVNGITVAILNYTYGTNGNKLPSDMPYAVNLLDKDTIKADVAKAKEEADFVIVCPHWGTEYIHTTSKDQEYWANIFASCGVDLVIGTHPHVIEPVKEIKNSDGDMMPVFYSLGNFINSTAETGKGTADRMVGAMAKVTLKRTESGIEIDSYEAVPLVTQMAEGRGKITTYFLSDYTEELAEQNGVKQRDDTFSLDFCKNLCTEVFGEDAENNIE